MPSLRKMQERGDKITLYCAAFLDAGRWCNTGWEPGFDQMIQYFGQDFEISADRARFLAMFECPNCGAPAYTLSWGINADGMARGMISNRLYPPPPEEREAMRQESIRVREATAQQLREVAAHRKARKDAEKALRDRESGRDPIGPPNPWKRRT